MRSDVVKKGIPAAPNRSLLYALGYTKEELERPALRPGLHQGGAGAASHRCGMLL